MPVVAKLLYERSCKIASATLTRAVPKTRVAAHRMPLTHGLPTWLVNLPFLALHLICIGIFFSGIHSLDLMLCAMCYFARMFGITAGYHRYFSHRAYKTSRPFQFFMACLGCCAMQKGPLWWSAHHRHHHRFSDTEDDPHSPVVRTIWWSHIGWILAKDHEETDAAAVPISGIALAQRLSLDAGNGAGVRLLVDRRLERLVMGVLRQHRSPLSRGIHGQFPVPLIRPATLCNK